MNLYSEGNDQAQFLATFEFTLTGLSDRRPTPAVLNTNENFGSFHQVTNLRSLQQPATGTGTLTLTNATTTLALTCQSADDPNYPNVLQLNNTGTLQIIK